MKRWPHSNPLWKTHQIRGKCQTKIDLFFLQSVKRMGALTCVIGFFLVLFIFRNWRQNGSKSAILQQLKRYEEKTSYILFALSVQYADHNKKLATANFSCGIRSIGNGKTLKLNEHKILVNRVLPWKNLHLIRRNFFYLHHKKNKTSIKSKRCIALFV